MTGHCEHAEIATRQMKSNGVWCLYMLCTKCGEKTREASKRTVADFNALPIYDKHPLVVARRQAAEQFSAKWQAARLQKEKARQAENVEWWAWYKNYLKSDKWKKKRAAVLKRDNHLCRACLCRTATQVHHWQGYAHVGDEPLFDLIAVCATCHDKITRMDREGRRP